MTTVTTRLIPFTMCLLGIAVSFGCATSRPRTLAATPSSGSHEPRILSSPAAQAPSESGATSEEGESAAPVAQPDAVRGQGPSATLQGCFGDVGASAYGIDDVVVFSLEVSAEGRVQNATVTGVSLPAPLANCLTEKVMHLKRDPGEARTETLEQDVHATLVQTGLSKDIVRMVVRAHQREVRKCYEETLNKRPDVTGRMTIRWVVAADGTVIESSVDQSDVPDEIGVCVAHASRRWRFPSFGSGGVVVIRYPFLLRTN